MFFKTRLMTSNKIQVSVNSEIGKLNGVILHTPGAEVENMTPENAERALYSDILNLNIAQQEYQQLSGFLSKVTNTFQVKDLLNDVLQDNNVRKHLIDTICKNENIQHQSILENLSNQELARQLLEGVENPKDTLSAFLSDERYILRPLHNFFFTRDASMTVFDKVLIGRMANKVRERESLIMQTIFDHHPRISAQTINPVGHKHFTNNITIEGGDVLIAREDVLVIGNGSRTTTQGIDFILKSLQEHKESMHIIVQELPHTPESFIHMDMVFTFLDKDKCMAYEPLILKNNKYKVVHIAVDNGKVKITEEESVLKALRKVGIDLEPLMCGGSDDSWTQQREQWHSGANFFAFAPGKVLGYSRNIYTIEALNKNGFEVIKANEVINGEKHPDNYKHCVVTLDGSELPRGGGGARCMTMPFSRENVEW